jgi:hypothetical protein
MNFRERLHKATERGKQARNAELRAAEAQALSEEECRRRHSAYRLAVTEHIEHCLRELADNVPGFRLETIIDDRGWGSAASRDDMGIVDGRRMDAFSRLQVLVGPYNKYQVLEIVAKGTVRNKETFSRSHYQRLADVDLERFRALVEQWVLDYAEMYAAAV